MDRVNEEIPKGYSDVRQAEWMIGRILIQSLCSLFDIKYRGVLVDETGKPFLKGSSAHISISHSFPMAAAMINLHSPCGIDLERKREKLITIQDKFVNQDEVFALNDLDKLCAIWCGKEVLYKIYGRRQLSMKDDTTISFDSDQLMIGVIHKEQGDIRYMIKFEPVKDFYLAYNI